MFCPKNIWFALSIVALPALAEEVPVSGALRVDCIHNSTKSKGSAQGCFQISGLKLTYAHQNKSDTSLSLTLDPFGVPSKSLEHLANTFENPLPRAEDSQLGIVSDYRLIWQVRSRLALGIENFGGSTLLPKVHRLALGSRFSYSGWNQAAMTATYRLGKEAKHQVMFAVGNGEGEGIRNIDPQQYGALAISFNIMQGLSTYLGGSFDGNNYGSESTKWIYNNDLSDMKPGFSTQRMVFAILSDGKLKLVPGLEFSISLQRSQAKDLNKDIDSINPEAYVNNNRLALRDLYVEDPTKITANVVSQEIFDFSAYYAILARHFISINYETRTVDTNKVQFFEDNKGGFHKKLSQAGYGAGVGLELDRGLMALFEYRTESYGKDYKIFAYKTNDDKSSKSLDLFNARILYNW